MYERFTGRLRTVMQLANQEAQRFHHEYIGTEHILLGLVKEGTGAAGLIFASRNIDLQDVRREVEKLIQAGPDLNFAGKLPQTPRAKNVITFAAEEARNLNHNYIDTAHLLLGLLREQDGIGGHVLSKLGLEYGEVKEIICGIIHSSTTPSIQPRNPMNPFDRFVSDVTLTANPNASSAIIWGPLLTDFLSRLMDCLFSRFGGGGTANPNAPAIDDEWPEPLEVAAADDWISKAEALQTRLRRMESNRRVHSDQWGGYKPAGVRRGMATLRRTVRDNGQRASEQEIRQHVIATYDNASGMRVEELAEVLKSESERHAATA